MISRNKRIIMLLLMAFVVTNVSAVQYSDGGGGAVNYSYGYDGLKNMCGYVLTMMTTIKYLLYAVAAIVSVYSSCSIYIKMNTGGDGITKDIIMLVGACLFLISAMLVLPAFFGINYSDNAWTGWWGSN